jgi:hypothetical protein
MGLPVALKCLPKCREAGLYLRVVLGIAYEHPDGTAGSPFRQWRKASPPHDVKDSPVGAQVISPTLANSKAARQRERRPLHRPNCAMRCGPGATSSEWSNWRPSRTKRTARGFRQRSAGQEACSWCGPTAISASLTVSAQRPGISTRIAASGGADRHQARPCQLRGTLTMLDPATVQVLFADLQPQIVARSKTNPPVVGDRTSIGRF